jgi:CheY-like chemotaxis protein
MQKLLIVGQCDFDYQRISFVVKKNYNIEIHRADLFDDAIQSALDTQYDLIMINRLLDIDRSEGMAVLHELKSNPQTEHTPVMIISDYQEAQEAAVAAGASLGFGKATLDTPQTFALLSNFLMKENI